MGTPPYGLLFQPPYCRLDGSSGGDTTVWPFFDHHFLCVKLCGYDIRFDASSWRHLVDHRRGSIVWLALLHTHDWVGEKAVWGVGSLAREGWGDGATWLDK